ncbi:damage-control phosphatase ARMT1 [Amyelois transitella]|uniref:damage-control phosphatase ARMT1 n=1 Tax=Amyelois transitella TaxID=680683 RepID=UPI00067B1EE3|nr:damage-control phosphatase ARMT1 [Amyelois transitella]XP_060803841.1 damage-control phosphatase ARMT1 [Amyelois transitella]
MGAELKWPIDTEHLPVMKLKQPINVPLCGIYGRSFAYYSLIERIPRIINKIIDQCKTEGSKIKLACDASDKDLNNYIQQLTKIKTDLVTNQCYELINVDTPEARKWNAWIKSQIEPRYFTNLWVYSECYIYRRIREAGELNNGLSSFDPFEDQKRKAFDSTIEMMCVVAEKLTGMLACSDKKKQREDFITLIKLCLWSNQCDLSLTDGADLDLDAGAGAILDPFEIIKKFKDKVLVDDSEKVVDYVIAKAESIARSSGKGGDNTVIFDIVCDNAGYEFFADLCLAHFLVSQKIVQKVRFHIKSIPWFVSDVTLRDFNYVIKACSEVSFSKTVIRPEPREVSSEPLKRIARQWRQLVDDGVFVVMHDDFWTSPHVYKDMKTSSPELYRALRAAAGVVLKGDLNCRKLLNEVHWPPTTAFHHALQGFHPTAVISVRTVKADLICGLPPGKAEELNQIDDQWMQTGEYGTILFCDKVEPLEKTVEN